MCENGRVTVYKKHDPEYFEQAQRDIAELIEQANAGKIELAYVDEAGFAPQPPNRSAWTPSGETQAITAKRGAPAECNRCPAVVGPVGHDEIMAKYPWLMVLCVFDGHAATSPQAHDGDFGQCLHLHSPKIETLLGPFGKKRHAVLLLARTVPN